MPATPANKLVDDVIRMGLHPTLKNAGYTKQGRTFYRGDDPVRVVNVQSNRWNTADEAKFTINLGLFFPAVSLVSPPSPPFKGKPKEYDCTLRTRIGKLIPPYQDRWWTISPASEIVVISDDLVDAWNRYGAEWMERCSQLPAAREEAIKWGHKMLPAAISLALGEGAKAEAYFGQLIQTCTTRSRPVFENWGRKHGLMPQ